MTRNLKIGGERFFVKLYLKNWVQPLTINIFFTLYFTSMIFFQNVNSQELTPAY